MKTNPHLTQLDHHIAITALTRHVRAERELLDSVRTFSPENVPHMRGMIREAVLNLRKFRSLRHAGLTGIASCDRDHRKYALAAARAERRAKLHTAA